MTKGSRSKAEAEQDRIGGMAKVETEARESSSHRRWSSMADSQGTCRTPEGRLQGEKYVLPFRVGVEVRRDQPLGQKRRGPRV